MENLSTIILSAIILGINAAVVFSLFRRRKRGQCISCDADRCSKCCTGCPGSLIIPSTTIDN